MPQKILSLAEAPLSNDYLFGEVMSQSKVCKLFLEELLQTQIAEIVYIGKQEELRGDLICHTIRLDVFLKDEKGTRYNIEMQVIRHRSMERRVRYYQSGIDRDSLKKGTPYDQLPDSYIIFICDFDYFGRGLAYYERESRIKDCEDLSYDDGSHVIFLNSRYDTGNAPAAVLEFLDYIKRNDDSVPAQSTLMQEVKTAVHDVRNDKTKEMEFMTLEMKMYDVRMEGIEEGIEKERANMVRLLMKRFNLSKEEAQAAIEDFKEDNL